MTVQHRAGTCWDTQSTRSSQTLQWSSFLCFFISLCIATQANALLSGMHAMGSNNLSQSEHASSGLKLVAL